MPLSTYLALLADNSAGDISAADMRSAITGAWDNTGVQIVEGLASGTGSASANTTLIQDMLDNSSYKTVYVPEGEWYITNIIVPENKHLTGAFARSYTAVPSNGTRLRMNNTAQTTAVVGMQTRCVVSNIAVIGPGAGANAAGIEVLANGGLVLNAAVGYCQEGIDGSYALVTIRDCHVYNNTSHGITNVVDGFIHDNTLNVNGNAGIYQGAGANSTSIMGNRVEWNSGEGILLYQADRNRVVGNFVDRNGKVGISVIQCTRMNVVGNDCNRNGRNSSGTNDNDANIKMQQCTSTVVVGNTTHTDDDDDNTGYVSPRSALRMQANTNCSVVGNDLSGGTVLEVDQVAADTTPTKFAGNSYASAGGMDLTLAKNMVYTGNLTGITVGGSSSLPVKLSTLTTYSTGHLVRINVRSRDHTNGDMRSAYIWLNVKRTGTSGATGALYGLTNLWGTEFATSGGPTTISLGTVSTNGDSVYVQLANDSGNTKSYTIDVVY